jgi:hypothetical protein
MSKQSSVGTRAQRESAWRDRLARFASSGQTVEAFCRNEAVSAATFYGWRTRLRANDSGDVPRPAVAPASFIDLGTVPGKRVREAAPIHDRSMSTASTGIEVRIDLGGGIVLTLARH